MNKFNRSVTLSSRVRLPGETGYRAIKAIHESRQWIEVEGLEGSFQVGHIAQFTNRNTAPAYPAIDDIYRVESGSVFEKTAHEAIFVGKLNGRTLKQFIADQADLECQH